MHLQYFQECFFSVQTIYRLGMASEILVQGKNVHHTELRSLEMSPNCLSFEFELVF